MSFRVGQKVVCVFDGSYHQPAKNWQTGSEIFEGRVYTVRTCGDTYQGFPGIKLQEVILNGWKSGIQLKDVCYRASRFRPVAERKTYISIFKAMLKDVKEPALASRVHDGGAGR